MQVILTPEAEVKQIITAEKTTSHQIEVRPTHPGQVADIELVLASSVSHGAREDGPLLR